MNFVQYSKECTEKVNTFLAGLYHTGYGSVLSDSIAYSLNSGGKRIRPTLVFACANLINESKNAIYPAAACEMVHSYSLIHDDLPCMDDDDLRRGVATNHKVYGECTALLAGDALLTDAFTLLSSNDCVSALGFEASLKLVHELSKSAGSKGMVLGQSMDMSGFLPSVDNIFKMQHLKTGCLITSACRMGAIAAGADDKQLSLITEFASNYGLLFQVTDDILDVIGDENRVGKAVNKDMDSGKINIVTSLGIDVAKIHAQRCAKTAIESLSYFGEKAEILESLVEYTLNRDM